MVEITLDRGVAEGGLGRISEDELAELRRRPVAELAKRRGVALKKRGSDLVGLCPFHEDTDASFVVTPSKNLWNCFGCNKGGGPIDFVMASQDVSFRHAVELMREGAPLAASVKTAPRLPMLSVPRTAA